MKVYQLLITTLFMIMSVYNYTQSNLNTNSIKANQSKYTDSMKIGRFHVRFTNQFDEVSKQKTKNGLIWLDDLMDTDNFRSDVEGLKYKNTRIKNKTNKNCTAEARLMKRYNSVEIFDLIIKGNDGLGTYNDNIIDLYLDLDPNLRGNVLGSTSCGRITSGKLFFQNNSKEKYASHLIHEYMHVLGFNHFLNKPLFRSFFLKRNDPAYQIGKLTRSYIKN